MSWILAALLIGESLFTALWLAAHLQTFAIYDSSARALIAARGVVAALQFAGGLSVGRREPAGARIGIAAFTASAVLMTFEIGWNLAPNSVFPTFRWWLVGGYWLYAVAACSYLAFRVANGE